MDDVTGTQWRRWFAALATALEDAVMRVTLQQLGPQRKRGGRGRPNLWLMSDGQLTYMPSGAKPSDAVFCIWEGVDARDFVVIGVLDDVGYSAKTRSITEQTAADLAAIWAEVGAGGSAASVLKKMEKAVRDTPSLWPEIERALNALCARIEEEMDDEWC